jgi:valyl-tRNA synthetase
MPHVTEEIWTSLPGRTSRLIVAPWPEAEAGDEAEAGALDAVQSAAATFRRSGVLVPLEGDELRIFEIVVKPERQKANGNVEAERERLQGEIARAETMLANERFVQNAPAEVVDAEREKLARYQRELDAIGG